MIKSEDLYVGQKLWYMYFRVNKGAMHEPVLAIVKKFESTWRFQVELEDPKSGTIIISELRDLYQTESDAWEAWNSGIYNRIDYLRSKFEKEIKRLKQKLYNVNDV